MSEQCRTTNALFATSALNWKRKSITSVRFKQLFRSISKTSASYVENLTKDATRSRLIAKSYRQQRTLLPISVSNSKRASMKWYISVNLLPTMPIASSLMSTTLYFLSSNELSKTTTRLLLKRKVSNCSEGRSMRGDRNSFRELLLRRRRTLTAGWKENSRTIFSSKSHALLIRKNCIALLCAILAGDCLTYAVLISAARRIFSIGCNRLWASLKFSQAACTV